MAVEQLAAEVSGSRQQVAAAAVQQVVAAMWCAPMVCRRWRKLVTGSRRWRELVARSGSQMIDTRGQQEAAQVVTTEHQAQEVGGKAASSRGQWESAAGSGGL